MFDEWSIPDFFIIYETLWHMIEPDAEREVIQTYFDEWLNQLREKMRMAAVQATPIPSQLTDAQKYEAILLQVDRYMADVMSMSKRERDAATVTATCDGSTKAWQVSICIKGENLRQATKEWFLWSKWDTTKEYRAETDEYIHYCVFLPEWMSAETNTLVEIEYPERILNEDRITQLNGDTSAGIEVAPVQETDILEYTDGYMADVLSMNKQERSASVMKLEYPLL